jgi:hypothetical protein
VGEKWRHWNDDPNEISVEFLLAVEVMSLVNPHVILES